jgi:hypothetical protein
MVIAGVTECWYCDGTGKKELVKGSYKCPVCNGKKYTSIQSTVIDYDTIMAEAIKNILYGNGE